ncbi:MAG TPA: porin [Vineibacter sp.]|nr:porin [Vineibacter sp.]
MKHARHSDLLRNTDLRVVPYRQLLAASTALVVAGLATHPAVAADPIKLELRGFWNSYILLGKIGRDVVGTTGTSYRPEAFRYEGEVWFTGSTKLDNGTTVGIRIELEGWSNNTGISATTPSGTIDQIDEEYIFAFGDWGRIEFGATDAASYKTQTASPSVMPGWGFQDQTWTNKGTGFTAANNGGRVGTTTGMSASLAANSGDANKFTYLTPRFAGLQLGLSYTPSFSGQAVTATCPFRPGGANFNNCPRNNNAWHNGIDISANYANKFGDLSVKVSGGYMTAGFDRGTSGPTGIADNTGARWKSWAAGAQLAYAGFTLGGGLGRDNNGLRGDNATRWYTAALMFESGRWMMSAGWWGGRNNDGNATVPTAQNAPGKDKMNMFEVGTTYALSPGIRLVGGLNYVMGSGQSKSEKADSWAVILGTALTF